MQAAVQAATEQKLRGGDEESMEAKIVQACLAEIQQLWLSSPEASRPESVWVALHKPTPRDTVDPKTAVLKAWFLNRTGLSQRQASDYVRFINVHSGRGWASSILGPPASGIFNNRPGRMHTIGLAAFAMVEDSEEIYLQYIFGGTTGRGSIYEFADLSSTLQGAKDIWQS